VTEVRPAEIVTRYSDAGKPNPGLIVFDRSWNVTQSGGWKYSPNDGSGVQMPLAVGKTWSFRSNDVSAANGNIWKRSGSSKVVGQESLTTKAGTFDTFKIEMSYLTQNVADPTRKTNVAAQIWYAPAINHWVKRTFTSREDKNLLNDSSIGLVEYGRKQ
jgi:hypothetical protein